MNQTPEIDTPPDGAVWLPITSVAPIFGISRDLMLAAIERGELPIRHARFGLIGLVFVARADVHAYLRKFADEELQS